MYFDQIEGQRGEAARAVFATVRDAMPEGYALVDYRDSPHWVVPLSTFGDTYNGQPLAYVTLMAQKNYNSLYLMGLYSNPEQLAAFRAAWTDAGLKLDLGKSCLRFKTLADVSLELLSGVVSSLSVDDFLSTYHRVQRR